MSESPQRPNFPAGNRKFLAWGSDGEDEGAEAVEVADPEGDSPDDGSDSDSRIRTLETEREELRNKHKAEKKRADDAEKKFTDKEREGMEDAQRTEAERDDYKAKYEQLLKFVETSYVDTAIMKASAAKNKDGSPKYDWHDAAAVRTFIDQDAIKLDMDTGEVDGLGEELKRIAKEMPWMLVPQDDRQQGEPPSPGGPTTGSHPLGGLNRQREKDPKKLGVKYKMPGFVGSSARPM